MASYYIFILASKSTRPNSWLCENVMWGSYCRREEGRVYPAG